MIWADDMNVYPLNNAVGTVVLRGGCPQCGHGYHWAARFASVAAP
jgi:hypothetical protein